MWITFSGRSKSKIIVTSGPSKDTSTTTYRGRVSLFQYNQTLFIGPRILHPNQHSWDFSFMLPPRASCEGDKFSGPSYGYNYDPHPPIPASVSLHRPRYPRISHEVPCYISYSLEAKLVTDGSKLFSPYGSETFQPLLVKSHREISAPSPQPYILTRQLDCRSVHLIPGYGNRSLTLKDWFRSLNTSTLPVASFRLGLELPRVCVMG